MPHNISLISTIAVALGAALLLGFVAARLKLPALVGYLLAGIAIGPATPGFIADVALAAQLAEIGVMLLMFGVGLHFSLADLLAVRKIAVPGAIVQMAVATVLGMAVAFGWGWDLGAALVFGLALWMHFRISGGWLHAKLLLVALMLAYFIVCGRWLKGVDKGRTLPSSRALRWINELPVFALIAVVYLVIAKPM